MKKCLDLPVGEKLYNRKRLLELIHQHAIRFGDFTLASGKKATYYLDCRQLTLDGEAANLIAEGMIDTIGDQLPDAVGGMAIGADPITASVITRAWQMGCLLYTSDAADE